MRFSRQLMLALKLAVRSQYLWLRIVSLCLITMALVGITTWAQTLTFEQNEKASVLMGNAAGTLRMEERGNVTPEQDADLASQVKSLVGDAPVVKRVVLSNVLIETLNDSTKKTPLNPQSTATEIDKSQQTDTSHKADQSTGHIKERATPATVSIVDLTDPLVSPMLHTVSGHRNLLPNREESNGVAVSQDLAEDLKLKVGSQISFLSKTATITEIVANAVQTPLQAVFVSPDVDLSPALVAETHSPAYDSRDVLWYLNGIAYDRLDVEAVSAAGFTINSAELAVASSDFPDPNGTLISLGAILLALMAIAALASTLTGQWRRTRSQYYQLGMPGSQSGRIVAVAGLIPTLLALIVGTAGGTGLAVLAVRISSQITGFRYGALTMPVITIGVFVFSTLLVMRVITGVATRPHQGSSKRDSLRKQTYIRFSLLHRVALRELAKHPKQSLLTGLATTILLLVGVAGATILTTGQHLLTHMYQLPSLAPNTLRLDTGTAQLDAGAVNALQTQFRLDTAPFSWASIQNGEDSAATLAIDTPAFACDRQAMLNSAKNNIVDRRKCVVLDDFRGVSQAVAIIDPTDLKVFIGETLTEENMKFFMQGGALCLSNDCQGGSVSLSAIATKVPQIVIPTQTVAPRTTRLIPAVLISSDTAQEYGISNTGAPPTPSGLLLASKDTKSTLLRSTVEDLPDSAQILAYLHGTDHDNVDIISNQEDSQAADMALLVKGGTAALSLMVTILLALVLISWTQKNQDRNQKLSLMGVSRGTVYWLSVQSNLALTLPSLVLGTLLGTAVACSFLAYTNILVAFTWPVIALWMLVGPLFACFMIPAIWGRKIQ